MPQTAPLLVLAALLGGCSLAEPDGNPYYPVEHDLLPAPEGPTVALVRVQDEAGAPFQPTPQVSWYPLNAGATEAYAARCADAACTHWAVTGAAPGPIYVGASYREETRQRPYCGRSTIDGEAVAVAGDGAPIPTVALTLGDYAVACE
jgi:hypothetical protein